MWPKNPFWTDYCFETYAFIDELYEEGQLNEAQKIESDVQKFRKWLRAFFRSNAPMAEFLKNGFEEESHLYIGDKEDKTALLEQLFIGKWDPYASHAVLAQVRAKADAMLSAYSWQPRVKAEQVLKAMRHQRRPNKAALLAVAMALDVKVWERHKGRDIEIFSYRKVREALVKWRETYPNTFTGPVHSFLRSANSQWPQAESLQLVRYGRTPIAPNIYKAFVVGKGWKGHLVIDPATNRGCYIHGQHYNWPESLMSEAQACWKQVEKQAQEKLEKDICEQLQREGLTEQLEALGLVHPMDRWKPVSKETVSEVRTEIEQELNRRFWLVEAHLRLRPLVKELEETKRGFFSLSFRRGVFLDSWFGEKMADGGCYSDLNEEKLRNIELSLIEAFLLLPD